MRTLKTNLTIIEGNFTTGASGEVRQYLASDEVRKLVGQATSMRVCFVGIETTSNARLTLKLFESAYTVQRPSELGDSYAPSFTSSTIASLLPAPIQVPGPFCDNVDIVIEADDNGSASLENWRGGVYATLYFD